MKIVVAPDSFKGSMTAGQAATSIKVGILKVYSDADIVCVPMADGGEGTVQSLVDATSGRIIKVTVKGPLLEEVEAFYGILGDGKTAVIEMAAASGLPLVPAELRNPLKTTSYGTGELICNALDMGCREIIIGIGGSATNDGGFGMLKALGVRFLDSCGDDIGFGGEKLGELRYIDISKMDERIKECRITAACDVNNPLCGPDGATRIFGPQKGAVGDMLELLDKGLENYAKVIKDQLGSDVINYPGAGAAGGMGAGLLAFLGAQLKKGIDIVIETTGLDNLVKGADLVITGEGMMDYQTRFGKTPYGVASVAKRYDIPVIALVGSIGKDAYTLFDKGIDSIFSIMDKPMQLEEAFKNSTELMQNAAERVMRLYRIADKR